MVRASGFARSLEKSKMKIQKHTRVIGPRGFGLVFALLIGGLSPAFSAPGVLAPHRAVYDLVLDRTKGSSGIDTAQGRIVFELESGRCKGIVQTFRQLVILGGGEIGTKVVDSQSITSEDPDGKTMKFSVLNRVGDQPAIETSGIATKKDTGLDVRLSAPIKSVLSFPATTSFPGEHYRALIEAAQAGQTLFSRQVYDGADEGKSAPDTFAVIGKARALSADDRAIIDKAGMTGSVVWPVEIAYFDPGKDPVDEPSYRVSMDLLANGVSTALRLDYLNFSLKGRLVSLEKKEETPCP